MKLKEIQYHALTSQISSKHCCSWSEDNSLAILTKNGILIVDFQLNLLKLTSPISTKQSLIAPPSSLPTNQFHEQISKLIPRKVTRDEFHQMILDKNLYPCFNKAEAIIPVCKQFSWSPQGLNYRNRCLMVVLTDTGSCSIYVRGKLKMVLHKSISNEWVKICAKQWDSDTLSHFNDLQERVHKISIKEIVWSHAAGDWTKKTALLVCAHENMEISLWRVETMAYNMKAEENMFLDLLKPDLSSDVKHMQWTQISCTQSILFICCYDGTVHGLNLKHDEMLLSCNLSSTFIVWDHADLILVSKIITLSSSSDGNEILIAMLKGFHVVVSSVKIESSTPAQPALLHKFSTQITGLEKINDEHLICGLWNGAVHLISVKTGLLTVDAIEKDISYANYCCQGLALSRNGAFAVLCNSVSKFFDHSNLRQTAHFYLMALPKEIIDPALLIESSLKSKSSTVNSIADCLASYRFSIVSKEQPIPQYLEKLDDLCALPDNVLQIYLRLFHFLAPCDPLESEKWRKLSNLITTVLYARFFTRKKVSNPVVIQWLYKTVKALDSSFKELIAACEQLVSSAGNQKAVCVFCDGDVSDVSFDHFSCSSGHKVPICAFSFQPCLVIPYCVCDGCGAIALQESVSSMVEHCVICGGDFQIDLTVSETHIYDGEADDADQPREETEVVHAGNKFHAQVEEEELDDPLADPLL
ncbi:unnamed protein product [Bemisia tabaci]|uniref:Transcription factor IIIC 90kDa subunit N-terminal domain-containing protein n=1 Tax=Bemisia tabaci TaxID=7038 RepID=A0A9P0G1B2_BEMTA|nr:unnamed protein product [Bemisia tabaci]